MFQFVSVSHPDEIKDRRKQGELRQHAIRNGIQRSKASKEKKNDGFIAFDGTQEKCRARRKAPLAVSKVALTKTPSISMLDPFDTLTGSPERLRRVMQHPIKAPKPDYIENPGKLLQGVEAIFRGASSDPALSHALSHVIQLSANNNLPDIEAVTHRGYLLNGIQRNIKDHEQTPQVSTLVAMLILIGYEYRIDGANATSIATYIRGVEMIMNLYKACSITLIDQVQKALFFQDVLSCLIADTSRIFSHNDFMDYQLTRDTRYLELYHIPAGFLSVVGNWPGKFVLLLEDLNALCIRVDTDCSPKFPPLDVCSIENHQANLESRAVDCLSDSRRSRSKSDPVYEACVYAVYICTYQLYIGIWAGCYIPEVSVSQIYRCISEFTQDHGWEQHHDLVLWLLFLIGATTSRKEARVRIREKMEELFGAEIENSLQDWQTVRDISRQFIWCRESMEENIRRFWRYVVHDTGHCTPLDA